MFHSMKKFNLRAFISLSVVFTFLIMSITGAVLYIVPPGRVAYWTNWTLFGLSKTQWSGIHTVFALLFLVVGGWHLYYNWKPFVSYVKARLQQGFALRKEMLLSTVMTLAVIAMTLLQWPPFSTIIELGEDFSNSWATEQDQPPIPHAERLTVAEFAQALDLPTPVVVQRLQAAGVQVPADTVVVQDLAAANGLSPAELYSRIQTLPRVMKASESSHVSPGGGYGRMTLAELAEKVELSPERLMQRLREHGIEATMDEKIRDVAMRHQMLPYELVAILAPEPQKSD